MTFVVKGGSIPFVLISFDRICLQGQPGAHCRPGCRLMVLSLQPVTVNDYGASA
jgi:hypothetical protein